MTGVGPVGVGTKIGVVLYQLANIAGGFKTKFAIYYPAAADSAIVEGQSHLLACEFTDSFNMAGPDASPPTARPSWSNWLTQSCN